MSVYNGWKRNAEASGKAWEVPIEYLEEVFMSQGCRCALTGQSLIPVPRRTDARDADYDNNDLMSLDRIDSSVGYIVGNVQITSWLANRIKNDLSMPDLLAFCKQVIAYKERKEVSSEESV